MSHSHIDMNIPITGRKRPQGAAGSLGRPTKSMELSNKTVGSVITVRNS